MGSVPEYTRRALGAALLSPGAANELCSLVDFPQFYGQTFYVSSVNGNDGNDGMIPDQPFATIDYAIGRCTPNKGDRIFAMPGHVETITGDIDVDVAGISIIGVGNGENRPVITFGTDTAAKIDVDAADCRIANLVLKNDIDSQAIVIDVDGAGVTLESLELLEGTAKQFLIGIDLAEDRATVRNCYIKSVAAGANSGIKVSAAKDRIAIIDNEIFGDFSDACIHNPTGNVATRLRIEKNVLANLQTDDHAIELVSACTGVINGNIANSTLAAIATQTAIDPGACYCNQNFGSDGVGDVGGVAQPIADA